MTPPTSGLVEAPLAGASSVPTKKCRTCGVTKPEGEYAKRSHRPSLFLDCRPCVQTRERERSQQRKALTQGSRPADWLSGRCPEPTPLPPATDAEMEWKQWAACRGRTDWFEMDPAEAKQVCAGCPVPTSCRRLVDEIEAGFVGTARSASGRRRTDAFQVGVWSGETPGERRARRQRKAEGRGEAWRKNAS